ncbi:MAG: hypothetical protein EHM58_14480 [Ignavibacteriae bacterium]|nr:MAG: hypothetical protein EHM58_14480 [Ignavibacteriota bacterium]
MNNLKPVLIILVWLSFLSFSHIAFSQIDDSLYHTNPENYVAKLLFQKKIVMLGDYGHHMPAPLHSVLRTLDEWLKICAESDSIEQKLFLVLEMHSNEAKTINDYTITGDFKPVVDLFLTETYLDDFEYYANLHKFRQKLDSINLNRNNKIIFEIKGYEWIGRDAVKNNLDFINRTPEEQDLWFVTKRDSEIASGLIPDVENNPDTKVLVFYGGGHLTNGYVSKYYRGINLLEPQCYGYYLVSYLKKHFGDENVVSIDQRFVYKEWLLSSRFDNVLNADIIINNKDFPLVNYNYTFFDLCIFRHFKLIFPRSLSFIFSRYVVEKNIRDLKDIEPHLPAPKAQNYSFQYLYYLNFLTGKNFKNVTEAESWYKNNGYDGLKRLESKEFADTLLNQTKNNQGNYRYILSSLGWDDQINSPQFVPTYKDWQLAFPRIKFVNCIGIYWIGFPDEKVKAKEYLIKFSGQDFEEPEKYLQWYRMKYYGYEY